MSEPISLPDFLIDTALSGAAVCCASDDQAVQRTVAVSALMRAAGGILQSDFGADQALALMVAMITQCEREWHAKRGASNAHTH